MLGSEMVGRSKSMGMIEVFSGLDLLIGALGTGKMVGILLG